jgi:hypothetical protein
MSVVDGVFRRAGIVPTGAPGKRRARRAPQVVAGEVVEDVEVVPPGDDAESLINGLEEQLRGKDEWIAQFREALKAQMVIDKTALAQKDAELRRCQEEVEGLQALLNGQDDPGKFRQPLRERELAQGAPPEVAFPEAMGREPEGRMQAEKAARLAKEDAEAQAWMDAAQGAAPAAAGRSSEPVDGNLYAALQTLVNRAERLRGRLVQAGRFSDFVEIYNVHSARALRVLRESQEVGETMLFDFVTALEQAEAALEAADESADESTDEQAKRAVAAVQGN